jgi:hypothetical protein
MSDQEDKPGAEYRRGFTAGYQHAKAEELEHYRAAIEGGRQIYDRVIRGLIEVPTFADRDGRRLEVLREAHAAELHVGRPVLDIAGRKGCPMCMEARDAAAAWRPTPRLAACVARWPECAEGEYNPKCCRFPKSCSATIYGDDVTPEDLEPMRSPSPCRCGHPVGEHGVNGCTRVRVGHEDQNEQCPCRHTDDMLLNRGPVPAHNGHYGVPGCTCPIGRGGLVGTSDIEDCPKHGPMGIQAVADAQNPDYGVPLVNPLCIANGFHVTDCRCDSAARMGAGGKISGCSYHRERGDGHVPSCGACTLVAQRAARGGR